jgi:hypothetical protein
MPTDYTALDAAILKHIRFHENGSPVHPMYSRPCNAAARLASSSEPFRTIDRRLQALRKAGKIRFIAVMAGKRTVRRWVLLEAPTNG